MVAICCNDVCLFLLTHGPWLRSPGEVPCEGHDEIGVCFFTTCKVIWMRSVVCLNFAWWFEVIGLVLNRTACESGCAWCWFGSIMVQN